MSNRDLKEKLVQLWVNKKLAHFYIVQPSPSEVNPRDFTKDWTQDFLSRVLQSEKSMSAQSSIELLEHGHADILFVRKEDPHQNYSVKEDHFSEFFRFQNFKALELSHRFIVIDDAHSITTILANKLLKTLEEPAENTTILLLDPFRHEILPTISSRAIYLRIHSKLVGDEERAALNMAQHFKASGFDEDFVAAIECFEKNSSHLTPLFEYLKNNKSLEKDFIKHLVNYVSSSDLGYKAQQSFMDALQWYEKASTFNNYSPEKVTGLLQSLTVSK
ncbi:hypothetical protein A9Q84_15875 [Halobacteriovorax marinus]|uniref:Uncharacterized protein n=1 Tax=Halobacteriovorax marinus TaxID=97084 RepID=A0A1Y5F4J5_9BACT|nr:hypothetical protein A9Q84_15875 [Halobacteriovorax marinus]